MDIDINGVNTVNENPTENNRDSRWTGIRAHGGFLAFFHFVFLGTEYLFDDMPWRW